MFYDIPLLNFSRGKGKTMIIKNGRVFTEEGTFVEKELYIQKEPN